MNRRLIGYLLIITFWAFLFGCNEGVKQSLSDSADDKIDLPLPQFDIELEEIRQEFKDRYKAKEVKLSRPYFYVSEEDNSYWLKIAFLNPDIDNKTLREFGKEVALSTLMHLTNPDEFERIEINVTQKTGFIITFTKSENTFFYVDSLRVNH